VKIRTASLVELHAFLAVCTTGSTRQAAEKLCVTPAAVSRAVVRLEKRLGCALFERSAQGVVPNSAAQALRARIEPSLMELERTFAGFATARTPRSLLRLSTVPTLGTRWLMPRLPSFHAAHPDINVELRQFHHNEDFRRDDVDMWIDIKRPNRRWPRDISARYLIGREITPVCTPAVASRLKHPADLLGEVLLHHTNFPDNWKLWLDTAKVNTTQLRLGGGYDVANNLIVAAIASAGVAVIQPCLIERELASGELVLPFDLMVSTGRGYYVCTRSAADGSHSIEAFRQWLNRMASGKS
jgi:DNA-binding transcriptional LysR family regulator